jgi:putative membrane protein
MSYLDDPRVYFATERTLLSWQRTALSFIALGFVVERYAFMKNLNLPDQINNAHYVLSELIGFSLILVGTFIAFVSAYQHKKFIKNLSSEEIPDGYFVSLGPLVGYTVSIGGLLMLIWILLGFLPKLINL